MRTCPSKAAPLFPPAHFPVTDPEFKRAIEEIKLRAPIEEIVRQRVPELRQRGRLWEACCPFHEEKTPSFKVDPMKGTWSCYGACAAGGDVIAFVEKMDGVVFFEALQILADQTGVEIPRSKGTPGASDDHADGISLLKRVGAWYIERLMDPDAAAARKYLEERGFSKETVLSFGLGWAPSSGKGLVDWAKSEKLQFQDLDKLGLARRNERGAYDFFRGRLMFPIRDNRGQTVGFGARRLSDDEKAGPKYVNSTESPWFKKGTLVYGLDLATPEARKKRHLVLVEGYTDVMAAHQKGLKNTAAVLGTATTERHSKVLRRVGVDRISLVFDGDIAGQKAAYKALEGLLPRDFNIDVVKPPGGQDPCDVLMSEGLAPFEEALASAQGWFDFVCAGLGELHGIELSKAVDQVLALFLRIEAPVHREDLLRQLAAHLGMNVETLRAQMAMTPEARRAVIDEERRRREAASAPPQAPDIVPEQESATTEPARVSPRVRKAWGQIAGALLLDPSLVPIAAPWAKRCESEDISRVLEAILELHADIEADITPGTVLTALAEHSSRDIVGKLVQHAEGAESPKHLLDDAISYLKRTQLEAERASIQERLSEREIDESDQLDLLKRFQVIQEELQKLHTTTGALAPSH